MAKIPTTLTLTTVGLLVLAVIGCHDAPQKNPFDPESGELKILEGDYTIETQEEFDALVAEGGEAFEVNGSVEIKNSSLKTLEGLEGLVRVHGDLQIGVRGPLYGNDSLRSLTGLNNLVRVDGDLEIVDNRLTNLEGLSNLTIVGGSFSLQVNNLATLRGMESLNKVGRTLFIQEPSITNLEGLQNLTYR